MQKKKGKHGSSRPFSEINKQINDNYSEIQRETTKAIIDRLGLGTEKPALVEDGCQTEGKFIQKSKVQEIKMKLFDITEAYKKLLLESTQDKETLEVKEVVIEKKKASLKRKKSDLKETLGMLTGAKMKVGELETIIENMSDDIGNKVVKIEELVKVEIKLQEVAVGSDKKIVELEVEVKTVEDKCVWFQHEVKMVKEESIVI